METWTSEVSKMSRHCFLRGRRGGEGLVGVGGNIYDYVRYCHFTRTRAVFFLLQNIFRDFERF